MVAVSKKGAFVVQKFIITCLAASKKVLDTSTSLKHFSDVKYLPSVLLVTYMSASILWVCRQICYVCIYSKGTVRVTAVSLLKDKRKEREKIENIFETVTISLNHRLVEVGRALWRKSGPTPMFV